MAWIQGIWWTQRSPIRSTSGASVRSIEISSLFPSITHHAEHCYEEAPRTAKIMCLQVSSWVFWCYWTISRVKPETSQECWVWLYALEQAVAVEGVPVVKAPPHTSQRPALEGVHTPVTHASSSWGHCQSESSFAYSHNLWTFHPKHHAAQTMTDGDEAGAQGYSFCDQFPADSKTVFTSIFFSLMEGLPGKGRFLKLWLWRKKKTRKIST